MGFPRSFSHHCPRAIGRFCVIDNFALFTRELVSKVVLGGLLGSLLGGGAQAQQQAGTQMAGGLGNLTDMLSQLGLGDQVKSWVGTGENLPVTAEQIQNSLGQNGTLGQIASQAGVSETEAAGGLAELLPGLINKLTPNGQIDANDITSILGSLLGGNKQ